MEREKTSQRTHENLKKKAEEGLVVGGKCFGFDNTRVEGAGRSTVVQYTVNPEQAEIVRMIFEKYASGDGLRAIVHDLNSRGIPSPRSGKRGTGSWSPSAIHSMLRNERYLGKIIWNRENEGVYRGGTKLREPRPESEWVIVERPDLRIISDELWKATAARFRAKQTMGRKTATGPLPRYLLTGFSRCTKCGGPIQVIGGKHGNEPVKVYSCAYHRERGTCDVTTRRPVDVIDRMVVGHLEAALLRDDVIAAALVEVRRRLSERAEAPSGLPDLEQRERQLQGEIRRLGEALLTTDQPLETVTQMLSEREAQLREVNTRVAAYKAVPSVAEMTTIRFEKEARATDLLGMMRRSPAEARKALEKVLTGPLMFTPIDTQEGRRFQVTGQAGLGSVFGISIAGVPKGIRTPVTALKGPCPGPG
jgi:site-specific DNA recombinase